MGVFNVVFFASRFVIGGFIHLIFIEDRLLGERMGMGGFAVFYGFIFCT